jgi:hypothetical protein
MSNMHVEMGTAAVTLKKLGIDSLEVSAKVWDDVVIPAIKNNIVTVRKPDAVELDKITRYIDSFESVEISGVKFWKSAK